MKQQVYNALENLPAARGAARVFGVVLLVIIVVNALLVGMDGASYDEPSFKALFVFNAVSTFLFFLEYVLRIWTADLTRPTLSPAKARLRYVFSVMGLIDLFSWLPMLVLWAFPNSNTISDVVRIIRLVRLIKVTRYMRGLKTIGLVIRKCQREVVAAFMVLALMCVASSVLMYEAEHAVQPDQFDSVLTGLYWAMTTMTSTGYGDLVPITPLGRLIGFLVMALSIGVVAIPAGIFSAGFVAEFRTMNSEKERDAHAAADAECCKASEEDGCDTKISDNGADKTEATEGKKTE